MKTEAYKSFEAEQLEVSQADEVVVWTAEQVQEMVRKTPSVSPWRVVVWQIATGLLVAVLVGLISGQVPMGLSAACGALAIALPAALFARGVTSRFAQANVGTAVTSFFLWEFVKVFMSVALLFMAHRYVVGLSWPAMLVGMVVTIKVYWFALGYKAKRQAA